MKKSAWVYYGIGLAVGGTALALLVRKLLVKYRVISVANYEWQGWGEPTIQKNGTQTKKGGFEANRGYAERVGEYWRTGTGQPYDGRDTDVAWSSAFISYIMKKAGAGKKFVYSPLHSKYITDSIANRKQGKTNEAFVGYKVNEIAPKVGDLVCYSRQGGIDYDTTGSYKSHCDLVVKKRKNEIEVIGGNVNNAVTKKILSTDNRGVLTDKKYDWFAVIKTNI